MWIRNAHRAHGLDTYIYIFLHIYFSGIQLLLHDFATFGTPSSRVSSCVCGETYPNKEGRVKKFQNE